MIFLMLCTLTVSQLTPGFAAFSEPRTAITVWLEDLVYIEANPDVTVSGAQLLPGIDVKITIRTKSTDYRLVEGLINVTNLLWSGEPWYDEDDDTVWHNRSLEDQNYYRVNDYEIYYMIYYQNKSGVVFFPPGSKVTWQLWARVAGMFGSITIDRWVSSRKYSYDVLGAWPYSPQNSPQLSGEELFNKNLQVSFKPNILSGERPNIDDMVQVTLKSITDCPITLADLYLNITYPAGNSVVTGCRFKPNDTTNLTFTASIERRWHTVPETMVRAYIVAQDSYRHSLRSENYSYMVAANSTFMFPPPDGKFEDNIALSWTPSEPRAMVPIVITIRSIYPEVRITDALIHFKWSSTHYTTTWGMATMTKGAQATVWSYRFEGFGPGYNLTFYVDAYDCINQKLSSILYSIQIPSISVSPERGLSIFFVAVYDEYLEKWVSNVNVTFRNSSWLVQTATDMGGKCYPNTTGVRGEPYYLSVNEKYEIEVQYLGTNATVVYELLPQQSGKALLKEFYNETTRIRYRVERDNDTIVFHFRVPKPPPAYAPVQPAAYWYVYLSYIVLFVLVIPVYWYWRKLIKKAEEERKRVTL